MSPIKKQGRTPVYEPVLKVAVARDYLTSELGYGSIAAKYDLPGSETVRHIVKWYRKKYPDGEITSENEITPSLGIDHDETMNLKAANLKIAGLEMLIQIAGQELGIDLVKKYGIKQLKK